MLQSEFVTVKKFKYDVEKDVEDCFCYVAPNSFFVKLGWTIFGLWKRESVNFMA